MSRRHLTCTCLRKTYLLPPALFTLLTSTSRVMRGWDPPHQHQHHIIKAPGTPFKHPHRKTSKSPTQLPLPASRVFPTLPEDSLRRDRSKRNNSRGIGDTGQGRRSPEGERTLHLRETDTS
ncbi:hypothetical protein BGZ60DRAFT_410510 [Tricladium varicosporioides]|nr:hypothetical protein BGZ60DRAFT_410510 [Hymenoscyphus varicosporioides]